MTPLYKSWYDMHRRCSNPLEANYRYYGGRGISVCLEWSSFEVFRDWARMNGYRSTLVLDRKNNNRGYNPDNCRWTTHKVNQNNRGNNSLIWAFGEVKSVSLWLEDSRCKVKQSTLYQRVKLGWPGERAITAPALNRRKP